MKVDCTWFSANSEAYFCESLGIDELQLASEHLKTCLSCRSEVQALQEVDPLVKQVLEYRMALARVGAQAPKRSIGFQLGLAGAGVILAAVLVFALLIHPAKGPTGILPAIGTLHQESNSPESPNSGEVKGEASEPVRAKPDAPNGNSTGKPVPESPIPDNAPEFQVIDPAGYSTSLQDYRGRVLLIGIWSADQPEAARNLQHLYQIFGTRNEVRILGVSSRNQTRLAGTTFPMVFNNGSRLLEAASLNYVVVDKEGAVQMRGSLLGDSNLLISKVRAKLDELGSH